MTEKQNILKKYWGHDGFRPLQEDIIDGVLAKKDVLAILPTGGGKSICFQVPAMMTEGICLVISPLIALIRDQVENLRKKGIGALAVYAGMPYRDVKQTLQNASFGNYKFLYVSPERLETELFQEYLPALKPALIAVDEAHCISQWGYDFRPSYLRIAEIREHLPGVPVIALTASATTDVQNDICAKLLFNTSSLRIRQSFVRPNLSYSVFNPESKDIKLLEILKAVSGSSIVYCRTRKQTADVGEFLRRNKIDAAHYHAGLSADERSERQDKWIKNKIRTIVCTNAFGMGIDKPDVRTVVHYDIPDCPENYYQEAGRAGRDGHRSYAVLLYQKKEVDDLLSMLDTRYPDAEKLKKIYIALMNRLAVAAGTGEGLSFEIDIASFAKDFKLNILEAACGLQALAQENIITFNEFTFRASTVEFIVNKNDINEFIIQHPEMDYLVKGLLRSYEGIFDRPVSIYEHLLAKFLQVPFSTVCEHLTVLNNYRIISYSKPAGKPEVMLLQNRMYTDDIKINSNSLAQRKAQASKRAKAMSNYILDKIKCRSKMISRYFGDDAKLTSCGICDNCIENISVQLSKNDFARLAEEIKNIIRQKPLTIKQLFQTLKHWKERNIWQVLNYFSDEEMISVSPEEVISMRNK